MIDYRKLYTSSMQVLLIALAVNLIGLFKEQYVAYEFGLGLEIDVFTMAVTIPFFLSGLFGSGLAAAIVPSYLENIEKNTSKSFFYNFFILIIIISMILIVLSALLSIYGMSYIASGFSYEKLKYCSFISLILSPIIAFQIVSSYFDGVLNSHKRYFISTGMGVVVPIATILIIMFSEKKIALILCLGLYFGFFLKVFFQFLMIKREVIGFDVRVFSETMKENKDVIKSFLMIVMSSSILTLMPIIGQAFASSLGEGNVAGLSYANKLIGIGVVIISTVINAVVFPILSTSNLSNKKNAFIEFKKITAYFMIFSFIVISPFYIYSDFVVKILFERGNFNSNNTLLVSSALQSLLLYVPIYITGLIAAKMVVLYKITKVFFIGNLISLIIYFISCSFFVNKYGISGVGYSLIMVYVISLFYLFYFIKRESKK